MRTESAIAVRMVAASALRRTAAGSLALTILAALAMGFVLTIAAGARRTDSTFERFRAASKSADAVVDVATADPIETARRLDSAPGVSAAAGMMLLFTTPEAPGVVPGDTANGFGGLHSTFGDEVQSLRILEGRAADPDAADEVTISRDLADLGRFSVGERVPVTSAQSVAIDAEVTITGIHRWEFELAGQAPFPVAIFTPAFTAQWLPAYLAANGGEPLPHFFLVRLDDPSPDGQRRFAAWVADAFGAEASVNDATDANETIRGSLQVQTVALLAVAAFAGVATVLVLSQVADRTIASRAGAVTHLLAMGMTRGQRAAALGGPVVGAMVVAGAAAVLVAIAASPLLPVGFARTVEPSPGIRVDLLVLVPIAALMVTLVCGRSVFAAFRHAAVLSVVQRPRVRRLPAHASITARVGLQRALSGVSRAARGASRSAIVGVMVAVAGLAAVATFTASEAHLLSTPRAFGWSFDTAAMANDEVDESDAALLVQAAAMDGIDAYGTAAVGVGASEGGDVELLSFVSVRGDIHPPLLRGRAASAEDEVVLGARLADELGVEPGDSIVMYGRRGDEHPMTVAGVAVLPGVGDGEFGFAVAVSDSGAEALGVEWGTRAVVASIATGSTRADVTFEGDELGEQVDAFLPPALLNLRRAGDAPLLLSFFLAALAIGAVTHALVVTVRRSRHEAATLRCLGFVRRQVVATVAWQSAVYVALGLVAGIPAGLALGRAAWAAVASDLGVLNLPTVPTGRIVHVVLASVVVALATSLVPGWTAARASPGETLRSE